MEEFKGLQVRRKKEEKPRKAEGKKQRKREIKYSENHRLAEVGRDPYMSPGPAPCSGRAAQSW